MEAVLRVDHAAVAHELADPRLLERVVVPHGVHAQVVLPAQARLVVLAAPVSRGAQTLVVQRRAQQGLAFQSSRRYAAAAREQLAAP